MPDGGRYGETDPIGLIAAKNTYAYPEQNPLVIIDPKGLFGVAGAAGGAAFSMVVQMGICRELGADWATCVKCINFADVAVSALLGFFAPTWLGNVGGSLWKLRQTRKTLIALGGPAMGKMAGTAVLNNVRGAAKGTVVGTVVKAGLVPNRICDDECPKLPIGDEVLGFVTSLR